MQIFKYIKVLFILRDFIIALETNDRGKFLYVINISNVSIINLTSYIKNQVEKQMKRRVNI